MKKIIEENELIDIAKDVLASLNNKANSSATVLSLSGDLGAGKTTFSKSIAKVLKIEENIISPTFVIMKNYKIQNSGFKWKKLIHIDAYRLASSKELSVLGWEDLVNDKDNLIIMEWPEMVEDALTNKDISKVFLTHIDETRREILFLV